MKDKSEQKEEAIQVSKKVNRNRENLGIPESAYQQLKY